mmetsp:Transcript_18339/g.27226  ORF Transcript_18339/g.27226 Transcript_18339/m.27226 type:complete len:317 (-) Transcript_18339:191-1141(-)
MNTQWIKVLHVTDSYTIVMSISNDLVFHFLPALHRLFDKNLVRQSQSLLSHIAKHFFIVTDATTQTTESKGTSDHEGISDLLGRIHSVLYRMDGIRFSNLFINLMELVTKQLTIFRINHNRDRCSEYFHIVLVKDAILVEFDGTVECCLTSHTDDDTIRLFLFDDFFNEFRCDWKKEDMIGLASGLGVHVGLYRSNVGIHQDDFLAFFLEGLDSLSTRIIEFTSLSNRCSSRSKQQDLLDLCRWWSRLTNWKVNLRISTLLVATGVQKGIKHELRITGSTSCFRMELGGKVRPSFMSNTFVRTIVGICEQRLPTVV